jgi:hypothetical protein
VPIELSQRRHGWRRRRCYKGLKRRGIAGSDAAAHQDPRVEAGRLGVDGDVDEEEGNHPSTHGEGENEYDPAAAPRCSGSGTRRERTKSRTTLLPAEAAARIARTTAVARNRRRRGEAEEEEMGVGFETVGRGGRHGNADERDPR